MAELQKRQDVEDSSNEKVAGGLTPKEKPVEGMLPEYGQIPRQPGQSPSMFRLLQPKAPLHEHDKSFPSKTPMGAPSRWGSMDREPELLDLQRVPLTQDIPPPPPSSSQLCQLPISPEEQQNDAQAKSSNNSKIRQKAMDPIDCTKLHRALNGIRTQETASPIFNKPLISTSQQDNCGNAGLDPPNRPSRSPKLPKDYPHSIVSKSPLQTPLKSLSPLAAKRIPSGPNKHSPVEHSIASTPPLQTPLSLSPPATKPTTKRPTNQPQSPPTQFININIKGSKPSRTHENIAANNDQDGWNIVTATEDGYDALEVDHAGDMKGPLELELGHGHRDDGGWDLCG